MHELDLDLAAPITVVWNAQRDGLRLLQHGELVASCPLWIVAANRHQLRDKNTVLKLDMVLRIPK